MAGAFSPLASCDCPGCGSSAPTVIVQGSSNSNPSASAKIAGVPTWIIIAGVVTVGAWYLVKSKKRSRK